MFDQILYVVYVAFWLRSFENFTVLKLDLESRSHVPRFLFSKSFLLFFLPFQLIYLYILDISDQSFPFVFPFPLCICFGLICWQLEEQDCTGYLLKTQFCDQNKLAIYITDESGLLLRIEREDCNDSDLLMRQWTTVSHESGGKKVISFRDIRGMYRFI